MRWFLGVVLVVALLIGGAYAVGRFFLSNTLDVTRTINIQRPRAAIFAMANDLRIAREWSPYNARDPEANYSFSDVPGEGQSMRWSSNVREVGSGVMRIVNSVDNELVESIIQIGDRATLSSRLRLARAQAGTAVAWSVSASCVDGWINVPCRYMNVIMRSTIEKELDSGLARLKNRAEQLPPYDFEGLDILEVPVQPIDVMFVDVTLASARPSFADRDAAQRRGVEALLSSVATAGGQADTATLVRVLPQNNGVDGRWRFSVGYPYRGPAPMLVGSRLGRTPGGAALRGVIIGPRSQVPAMYQRLEAYRQAHRIGLRQGVDAWEVVTQAAQPEGADPADPVERTEIYFPIEEQRS